MKSWPLLFAALLLAGCSRAGPDRGTDPGGPVDELQYARTGGGNLEFSVHRSPGAFEVRITRREFKPTAATLSLRSPENLLSLDALFLGKTDLNGKPRRESPDRVTGTWVSAKVRRGADWWPIRNEDALSALRKVEDEVRERLETPPEDRPGPPAAPPRA